MRATFTRLTSGSTIDDTFSAWTPDGRRVVFRTLTGLYQIDADGGGRLDAIPNTSVADVPTSVSPDGRTLALIRQSAEASGGILTMSLEGEEPRVVVQSPAYDGGGQFSRDGRRFLMVKDDSSSGRLNVVLNWFEELNRLAPHPEN